MKFYKYNLFGVDVYESDDEITPFKSFWDMIWKIFLFCIIIPIITTFLLLGVSYVLPWVGQFLFPS